LAGLVLLIGESLTGAGDALFGSLLILAAAMCWALGVVLQKRYPVAMAPGSYTVWIMLLGSLPMAVAALSFEDLGAMRSVSLWPALGVGYNVLLSFGWGYWAWIKI